MKKILYSIFAFAVLLPMTASAATFSFSPNAGSFVVGNTFSVAVYANPSAGEEITVAKLSSAFSSDTLEVISFTQSSGWMSPVVAQFDSLDNVGGVFEKMAGFPARVTASRQFGTLTLKAKSVGVATITAKNDSMMLDTANVNKFVASAGANFSIVAPAPIPVFAPEPVVAPVSAPVETHDTVAPIIPVEPEEEVVEDVADDAQQGATTTPQEEGGVSQGQIAAAASSVDGTNSNNFWYYILAIAAILGGILAWRKWGK